MQGLIVLHNPSYEPKAWHGTLLIWLILFICCLFNTFFSRKLPLIEGVIVILHVAGFFAVIIPLWVMGDRGDTAEVFTKFEDNSGWNNLPLSTIIGLVGAASTFIGSEAGVHMADMAWQRASRMDHGHYFLLLRRRYPFGSTHTDGYPLHPGVPQYNWLYRRRYRSDCSDGRHWNFCMCCGNGDKLQAAVRFCSRQRRAIFTHLQQSE
jgi:hypothetical protein